MSALDKVDMLFRLLEKALSICALSHTRMCFLSPSGLELLAIKPSNQILFDSITSSWVRDNKRAVGFRRLPSTFPFPDAESV